MFKAEDFTDAQSLRRICKNGWICYVPQVHLNNNVHLYRTAAMQDTPDNRAYLVQERDAGQFLNDLFNEAPQEAPTGGRP